MDVSRAPAARAACEPRWRPPAPEGIPTPAQRLRAALDALGGRMATLAKVLAPVQPSTTRNYGLGRSPVPERF